MELKRYKGSLTVEQLIIAHKKTKSNATSLYKERIPTLEELKMASLYSDMFQNDFFDPEEIITFNLAKSTLELTGHRIEFINTISPPDNILRLAKKEDILVILANRYNHIVTNGNIIICNVIIAFITLVKLYTAIDVIPITALYFSVDRRIKYFAHTVKPHKLPYVIDKIAPGLRQCLLVIGSLDNSPRTFFEIHRNGVILRFQRIFNYIVWVAFNFSE